MGMRDEKMEDSEPVKVLIFEKALSGRSTCRASGEPIAKGEFRVGLEAYVAGRVSMTWQVGATADLLPQHGAVQALGVITIIRMPFLNQPSLASESTVLYRRNHCRSYKLAAWNIAKAVLGSASSRDSHSRRYGTACSASWLCCTEDIRRTPLCVSKTTSAGCRMPLALCDGLTPSPGCRVNPGLLRLLGRRSGCCYPWRLRRCCCAPC